MHSRHAPRRGLVDAHPRGAEEGREIALGGALWDRRFYRRKYDARKTLEGFSVKLRAETHLDALSDDLVGGVRETMQPTRVSVWLRSETPSKGRQAE